MESRPQRLSLAQKLRRAYLADVRAKIPPNVRRAMAHLYLPWVMLRISPRATRLLGPRFRRNRRSVDIDITWDCNLKCARCSRLCQQAPTKERMSLEQVRGFVEESVEKKLDWDLINIVGGEPAQHPQLLEIVHTLLDYRDRESPRTRIRVISNGFGEQVRRTLASLPPSVEVRDTAKTSPVQEEFVAVNLAPRDLPEYQGVDFSNACQVARDCGLGLTPLGYYPCSVAGALDRVLGYGLGRRNIPDEADAMTEELRTYCSWCGFFRMNVSADVEEGNAVMTPSWEAALSAWRNGLGRQPAAEPGKGPRKESR